MRKKNTIKAIILAVMMIAGFVTVNGKIEAAADFKTQDSIGYRCQYSFVTKVTINKVNVEKLTKSLKDKVSVTKTESTFAFQDGSYKEGQVKLGTIKTKAYNILFKKAGTYKITSNMYNYLYYYSVVDLTGAGDYEVAKYDNITGEVLEKEKVTRKTDSAGREYYENASGKIYAYSNDVSMMTTAKLDTDGQLLYDPLEYTKTPKTYTETIVINDYNPLIKSISLGNGYYKVSGSYSVDKGNRAITEWKKTITGKKGKVSVKLGKGYSVTSIVITTYDKKGNANYTLVKNNSTVKFSEYVEKNGVNNKKTTTVDVFYKDSNFGGYTKINSIEKKDGKWAINYTTVAGKGKKPVTETVDKPSKIKDYNTGASFIKK